MDQHNEAHYIEISTRERLQLMNEDDWNWLMDRYFNGRLDGYEVWTNG